MRKNGQFEQAYATVIPMYREHHGHYTTLCMFWTATDVMRLRIEAGKCDEAEQIFASLRNLYPNLQDKDHSAARTLNRLALMLATKEQELRKLRQYHSASKPATVPGDSVAGSSLEQVSSEGVFFFSLLDYMIDFGRFNLSEEDWQAAEFNGHPVPSFATKVISRIFHEVSAEPECCFERLKAALDMVEMGLLRTPRNRHLLRYQANLIYRSGDRKRAVSLYRQLTRNTRDAYLYSELASMLDDPNEQVALLAKAIQCQRTEAFAQRDRLTLASLLKDTFPQHAAYELQQVLALRESLGQHPNRTILDLQKSLADITPASSADQHEFYQRLIKTYTHAA